MKGVHYTLRIASACCLIGHGIFGLITKPIWCNYFGVFGIGHDLAYRLMPVVGSVDILWGLTILFYPIRAVFAWLVLWGFFTACLRPLSGEPFAELIERAGNFGAPLAFLLLGGDGWFRRVRPAEGIVPASARWCLRFTGFLLLLGHGWLNLLDKSSLLSQYSHLGFSHPDHVALVTGLFEVLSACWLLCFPSRSLLILLLVWKVSSELLYPHYELVEWIERGGSYGVLLALLLSDWKIDRISSGLSAPRNILGRSVFPSKTR